MKITKSQLKQIIKEEVKKITQKEFLIQISDLLSKIPKSELIEVPGVYEALKKHYYDEVVRLALAAREDTDEKPLVLPKLTQDPMGREEKEAPSRKRASALSRSRDARRN